MSPGSFLPYLHGQKFNIRAEIPPLFLPPILSNDHSPADIISYLAIHLQLQLHSCGNLDDDVAWQRPHPPRGSRRETKATNIKPSPALLFKSPQKTCLIYSHICNKDSCIFLHVSLCIQLQVAVWNGGKEGTRWQNSCMFFVSNGRPDPASLQHRNTPICTRGRHLIYHAEIRLATKICFRVQFICRSNVVQGEEMTRSVLGP